MAKPIAKILIDNSDVAECAMENIIEVVVEEQINLPTMFYFLISIVDEKNGPWQNVDLSKFTPGKAVTISMGLDQEQELFKGEITAVDISFSSIPHIEVRGFDRLHRLQFGRKNRSFVEQKDSQIVSTIASEDGLSATADTTTAVYPCLFQFNQTNYHFLLERARRIGFELMADDKKLLFRKSQEDKSPQSGFSFHFGKDIFDFNVRLRTVRQGGEVEARGWDMKQKTEIVGSGGAGDEISKMGGSQTGHAFSSAAFTASQNTIINENFIDKSDADTRAAAFYNETLQNFITGEGTYSGGEQIRMGTTIEVTNIGDKFSGNYYVTSTTHILNKREYTTKFKVRKTGI
ncbi:phage late control D family protein [Candidatus Uabimicrobium sp. HlEnr_7]|uniref:phage late control D family protein n=1 Tax=Candidatus Uabimicrobium helgolandensis TaxID=3095367 RepID=UPI0035577B41